LEKFIALRYIDRPIDASALRRALERAADAFMEQEAPHENDREARGFNIVRAEVPRDVAFVWLTRFDHLRARPLNNARCGILTCLGTDWEANEFLHWFYGDSNERALA
jgi:hypothetical protein